MTLQHGATLQGGKYIIKKVLGQGGFGITYLAEHDLLGTDVAIKEFFFKEYCSRDEETCHVSIPIEGNKEIVNRFKQKFIKEARTIFKLNHPNIVRIYDIFEENDTAYYVMEYCEGGSLGELIKNYPSGISETKALEYIKQIASALEYIHKKKMNHLDIKPGNIILNAQDEAVLIDFGLSKQYDAETGEQTSTTPVGISEGFAPIEQYKKGGVGAFSPATDIYALGATLFKLITGQTPPEASTVNEYGLPSFSCSISVRKLIETAMRSRRADRPQSIAEWLNILENNTNVSVDETMFVNLDGDVPNSKDDNTQRKETAEDLYQRACACLNRKEYLTALSLLQEAETLGHPMALYEIGICYYNGFGVVKNYVEAAKCFLTSAVRGYDKAQISYGDCFYKGEGVKQDYVEACKLYKIASEQGNAVGQLKYAQCLFSGIGVTVDYTKAFELILLSANQGNFEAYSLLISWLGVKVVPVLDVHVQNGICRLVEQCGKAEELFSVAKCYSLGNCFAKNLEKAADWYRKSAELGYVKAQVAYADCCLSGTGVLINMEEAKSWYRKAAEQGDADAKEILTDLFHLSG